MSVHDAGCSKAGQPHTGFESCCPGTTPTTDARERVTLESLRGSVPDIVPNPVSAEAWVRRFRDGYDAGFDAGAQAERARVRAVVEAAPGYVRVGPASEDGVTVSGRFMPANGAHWIARETILAALQDTQG